MAAGVDQATIELLGLRGAPSQADAESEKVVFFFTDGQPTLPYGPGAEADNVRAVLRAANRAQRGGIRIHSFAIGPDALEGPIATVEMASRTDGFFTPVRHPGDLDGRGRGGELRQPRERESCREHHDGRGGPSPFRTTADGTWAGFVQDAARHQSGARARPLRRRRRGRRRRSASRSSRRRRWLRSPRRWSPAATGSSRTACARPSGCGSRPKRAHQEKVRRELQVEIERERAKARERADEQRKQLQIGSTTKRSSAPPVPQESAARTLRGGPRAPARTPQQRKSKTSRATARPLRGRRGAPAWDRSRGSDSGIPRPGRTGWCRAGPPRA